MKKDVTLWLLEELLSDRYAQSASVKVYAPEECVFHAGDAGDYLGILLSGRVEIRKNGKSISFEGAGAMFGEMGLIDHLPRAADVYAVSHSRIMEVREGQFMALLEENAYFSLCVMRVLTERLRARMES